MNKVSVVIDNVPKIIHHDLTRMKNNKKKCFNFTAKKKIFTVKTKIQEENNRVMIDSYVEWYDIKKQRLRRKRFLQIYDCEDQELDITF